jgi:Na+/proline symporter
VLAWDHQRNDGLTASHFSFGFFSGRVLDSGLNLLGQIAIVVVALAVLTWTLPRRRQVWFGAAVGAAVWFLVVISSRGSFQPDVSMPESPMNPVISYEPTVPAMALAMLAAVLLLTAAWSATSAADPSPFTVEHLADLDGEGADEGPVRSSAP